MNPLKKSPSYPIKKSPPYMFYMVLNTSLRINLRDRNNCTTFILGECLLIVPTDTQVIVIDTLLQRFIYSTNVLFGQDYHLLWAKSVLSQK